MSSRTNVRDLCIKFMNMRDNNYCIYILTNWSNKVLYIGVTNNLQRRLYEHKNKLIDGFTKKYNLNKLVYYECFSNINDAIRREKELKKWRREKKNNLVENMNPDWKDLGFEFEDLDFSPDKSGSK